MRNTRMLLWRVAFLALTVFLLMAIGSTSLASTLADTVDPIARHSTSDVVLLITYVLLALFLSFICSVSEAVLLSITPPYIEQLRESQPDRAELLKRLRLDNVDRSLAAILTLNTIANTLGAVLAGAQATVVFGSAWIGMFSALMTLMILYLSEIIPKTIGAVYWPRLAGAIASLVNVLIKLLYPLIWVSERLTRLIARDKGVHLFSREEFIAMAGVGEQAGDIDEHESRIIRNLFRFTTLRASDAMTPRTVISALPKDISISEAVDFVNKTPFSRLPIYENDIDDIIGFVLKDDVMVLQSQGRGRETLEGLKRDIASVFERMALPGVLDLLLDLQQHIALVVDEFGGTRGLITLEDLLEVLLGIEIVDELDEAEDMRALALQQWSIRAKEIGFKGDSPEEGS
jgi:CBS domain containing-hemolysin-like protein